MVVLQEDAGNWPKQHFAFKVTEMALADLKHHLETCSCTVTGPAVLTWMKAVSLYFNGADGHELELCALRE